MGAVQKIVYEFQLPFEEPQIPSNGDHKALNRGTLGGAGRAIIMGTSKVQVHTLATALSL